MRGMWEGTPFPAFLLIKKVTKESDKLSKNKGSFRGDFYLIGKISCEIKKHTEDFFSKYPCVFVYVPERIRTAGLPLRRWTQRIYSLSMEIKKMQLYQGISPHSL